MSAVDPDTARAKMRSQWERSAAGWGRAAERVREVSMPVAAWMIDHLELQPGQRVLELAAGPGDTGFLAAELVAPGGGVLLSSDAAESMLEVARSRAQKLGVGNVEFAQLELEWIDLETASVDAVLCRWGLMFAIDVSSALREMRRVLRPGGRASVAVWDEADANPWATTPGRALVALGHAEPPDPDAPGMFVLAPADRLAELLQDAGFVDVVVEAVELPRRYPDVREYVEETLTLSVPFASVYEQLSAEQREAVHAEIARLVAPWRTDSGLLMPGRSLVAVAQA